MGARLVERGVFGRVYILEHFLRKNPRYVGWHEASLPAVVEKSLTQLTLIVFFLGPACFLRCRKKLWFLLSMGNGPFGCFSGFWVNYVICELEWLANGRCRSQFFFYGLRMATNFLDRWSMILRNGRCVFELFNAIKVLHRGKSKWSVIANSWEMADSWLF